MCLSAQGQILSPQTRKWRLIFMSLNTLSFIIWNTLQSAGGWELQSKERNPDRRVKTGLRPPSHQLGLRSRYLGGGLSIRFFSTSRFIWVLKQQQISHNILLTFCHLLKFRWKVASELQEKTCVVKYEKLREYTGCRCYHQLPMCVFIAFSGSSNDHQP